MKRFSLATLLLPALVVVLAGIGSWLVLRPAVEPMPAPTALVIATNTEYVGACPVMAAQAQGYFSARQLAVTLQPHTSGRKALEAVTSNQADMATVADIPIMFFAMDATPIQVISTIFRTGRDHGLVARRDRGIARPADLKGKRIGVTLGTSGHFTLEVFLNRQRLDSHDVTLVNYPPDGLQQAITDGTVDAVSGWDPFLGSAEESLGANAIRFTGADVYESIYNMVALSRYIKQNPQTMVRLLQALEQGERFCREHPAAGVAFFPKLSASGASAMLAAWPAHHFGLELDQSLLLVLEDQSRWAIKGGLTAAREVPNFLDYIYLDGLRTVSPTEVTIIY
ncbi:ABC transporter substrate-binding protein [Duganella sp. S19_KUP01_CR8]|uniref:ABC transporter substrate-binding protein n=1 Tax=Duganella sp. S19_KUP01_CR8 TaxID=3025502 RepID=UPI002FCD930A